MTGPHHLIPEERQQQARSAKALAKRWNMPVSICRRNRGDMSMLLLAHCSGCKLYVFGSLTAPATASKHLFCS